MSEAARFGEIFGHLGFLLTGLLVTLELSAASLVVATLLGMVVGVTRSTKGRWTRVVRLPLSLYVDFFRTTPLLVQLFWIYYVLPVLTGITLNPFDAGVISLGLYEGSYISEIFRGGIAAVDVGQVDAATALGMTPWQVLRRVLLPQAIFMMLPAFGNQFLTLIKDSSLASAISLPELLSQGEALGAMTLYPLEALTVTGVSYMVLTLPLSTVLTLWHRGSLSRGLSQLRRIGGVVETERGMI